MQLLSSDKFKQAKVNNNYFPFFHIKNAFLDNVNIESLVNDFPNIRNGGSFPVDSLASGELIHQLIHDLESREVKEILEDKFNINLDAAKVITTLRGYSRNKDGKIHTDSKTKILTVLLYLNKNWSNKEGNLRFLKENNSLEDYIEEIPCTFGSLAAFKVTDNCWHGFIPYEGKRLSVQLNYIYPEALKSHKIRHKLSSRIKSFFK
jgi:Rps23 Pro-64 3,4-dihydroxylase Tpa1-like proline 4-hydroxylase